VATVSLIAREYRIGLSILTVGRYLLTYRGNETAVLGDRGSGTRYATG
jgi:hypothetical protein